MLDLNRRMATGPLFMVLGKDESALVRQLNEKVKNKKLWNFRWIEEDVEIKEFTVKISDNVNFILGFEDFELRSLFIMIVSIIIHVLQIWS